MAKILIVEDSRDIADMLLAWLQMNGHHVEIAMNKEQATAKVICFDPNLLIINVVLSDGTGQELCKEIRILDKKIPLVLMSSNAKSLDDYLLHQANDIIEKPFNIADVIVKVDRLL